MGVRRPEWLYLFWSIAVGRGDYPLVTSCILEPGGVLYHNDIMRLLGRDVLAKAVRRHGDTRTWLAGWAATVEDASWASIDDVREDYPSADGVRLGSGTIVTVFNVRGNQYRLISHVDYRLQVVMALEVLTHAQYDKQQWKERY